MTTCSQGILKFTTMCGKHLEKYGSLEGLLRCAIATPAELPSRVHFLTTQQHLKNGFRHP